jgi:ubiquinone/menaquinone biosynthesis C-methylase UbiE
MSASITDPSIDSENTRCAFSAQAPHFDSYEKTNIILQWMRRQVYKHEEEFLSPGDNILELNAGTGIDAIHFAQHGHPVFAIDNAEGMVSELKKKVKSFHMEEKIKFARCSYTELETLPAHRFDHVFSNFGGLNCVADLRPVTERLPQFLKPGATITFVIMPHLCPWELIHIFSGNSKLAFRRLSRHGVAAHIEGRQFLTYYFSPREVARSFGKRFTVVKLRGLASVSPPPYMLTFAERHPRLYQTLTDFDERCSTIPPFNRWADHFIITMQYLP